MVFVCIQAPQPPPTPPLVVGMNKAVLPEAIATQLEGLEKAKDWPKVITLIESLKPSLQDSLLPTHLKALQGAGRFEQMLALCRAKIPTYDGPGGPRLSVARIGEAQALSRLDRHAEAAAAHLQNGRLGYSMGYGNALAEYRATQDFAALLSASEEILARSPRHPEAAVYRGEALAKLGRWTEAEPALNTALELDPKAAMAWADLACCRVERKAYPEAVEAADRALALDPRNLEALYNRGRARFGLTQYKEGREDLASALATQQADPAMAENLRLNIALADRYLAYQARPSARKKK